MWFKTKINTAAIAIAIAIINQQQIRLQRKPRQRVVKFIKVYVLMGWAFLLGLIPNPPFLNPLLPPILQIQRRRIYIDSSFLLLRRRFQNQRSIQLYRRNMNPGIWHKVAAISGMAALGLGTYGAHGFKPKNPSYKDVWQTASIYHLVHTSALLAAPLTKNPNIFGGLLTTGIVAFSGTCYAVAYLEDRKYSRLAPFGGFAFIAAWATLLF